MSLRKFFHRRRPNRLVKICDRVYVFDCCFSKDVLDENDYQEYLSGVAAQLHGYHPEASFMVFNFREGDQRHLISDILSQYDMTVMEYPRQYENCPLLPLEMIYHFLRSGESWLSLKGQQNVLLMHCENGGWPMLAFMLAGLLLYRRQFKSATKALETVYEQAPKGLPQRLSPFYSQPSQIRYLHYISKRNLGTYWPSSDTLLILDCLILRFLPLFAGEKVCRPIIRVYGHDPLTKTGRNSTLLFSSLKSRKHVRQYSEAECILVKLDINCHIQGDIVLECVHLCDNLLKEEIIFRLMFHTSCVRSNIWTLGREDIDVLWDARDLFPKDFRAEVLFSEDGAVSLIASDIDTDDDDDASGHASSEKFYEAKEIFSSAFDPQDRKTDFDTLVVHETQADSRNFNDVLKEDVVPDAFEDCSPDVGIYRQDMETGSSLELVKDIGLDDHNKHEDQDVEGDDVVEVKDILIDDTNQKEDIKLAIENVVVDNSKVNHIEASFEVNVGIDIALDAQDTVIADIALTKEMHSFADVVKEVIEDRIVEKMSEFKRLVRKVSDKRQKCKRILQLSNKRRAFSRRSISDPGFANHRGKQEEGDWESSKSGEQRLTESKDSCATSVHFAYPPVRINSAPSFMILRNQVAYSVATGHQEDSADNVHLGSRKPVESITGLDCNTLDGCLSEVVNLPFSPSITNYSVVFIFGMYLLYSLY